MLSEKKVPKTLWLKAVNWVVHVLNRSPMLAVKDTTLEEVWSGIKPSVQHFNVFGCVSYAHVPDNLRSKLDKKSLRCVLLRISEESKAYRLYDPISLRIIVSRDVVFEENEEWEWDKHESTDICELEWEDDEKVVSEESPVEEDVANAQSEESLVTNQETSKGLVEGRSRKQPAWLRDCVSAEGLSEEEAAFYSTFFALYTAGVDPLNF